MSRPDLSAKNFLINNGTTIAYLGLNAALTPWFIKNIGPATMGSWLACSQLISISLVMDGGISAIVLREIVSAEKLNNRGDLTQRLLVAGVLVSIFAAIAAALIGLVIGSIALGFTNVPPEAKEDLRVAIWFAAFSTGIGLPYYMAHTAGQVWGSVKPMGAVSLFATSMGFLTSAIIVPTFGIKALGIGALITAILRTFLGAMWASREFKVRGLKICWPLREDFHLLLKPATKSTGMRIVDLALNNIETTLAAIFISPTIATAISLNGRVFSLCQVIAANFANSRFTRLAESLAGVQSEKRAVSRKYFSYGFALAAVPMLLGLSLNREILDIWVGSQYYLGSQVCVLLLLARLALACNNLLSNYCLAAGLYDTSLKASFVEATSRLLSQAGFAALVTANWMLVAPAVSVLGVAIGIYGPAISSLLDTSFTIRKSGWIGLPLAGVAIAILCFWATEAAALTTWTAIGINLIMLAVIFCLCRKALEIVQKDDGLSPLN